jgi:hypothetical protein
MRGPRGGTVEWRLLPVIGGSDAHDVWYVGSAVTWTASKLPRQFGVKVGTPAKP